MHKIHFRWEEGTFGLTYFAAYNFECNRNTVLYIHVIYMSGNTHQQKDKGSADTTHPGSDTGDAQTKIPTEETL